MNSEIQFSTVAEWVAFQDLIGPIAQSDVTTAPLQIHGFGLLELSLLLLQATHILGMCIVVLVGSLVEAIIAGTLAMTTLVMEASNMIYLQIDAAPSSWLVMFLSVWIATPSIVKSVMGA